MKIQSQSRIWSLFIAACVSCVISWSAVAADANTEVKPAPPAPPKTEYSLPATKYFIGVKNSEELLKALKIKPEMDIILDDGVYEAERFVKVVRGHRLWAKHPGKAVIKFGFIFGSNWKMSGAEFHGLNFDVDNPKKLFHNGCIMIWGKVSNVLIEDCRFNGNKKARFGILARNPDGLTVRRVVVRDMAECGIMAVKAKLQIEKTVVLEDIDIARTGRCGLRVGNTATVRRVKVRDCSSEGIWTGNLCEKSVFEDFDIDKTVLGVNIENVTSNTTFSRFSIGPQVKTGFTCDWGGKGKIGAARNCRIQDGTISVTDKGIYMDDATTGVTINNVLFRGASWGGVGMFKTVDCKVENCHFELPEGVKTIRTDHWKTK